MLKSIFHTINLKRLNNLLRCRLSYAKSTMGIVEFNHYPTFISIEPANFCMLSCPECPIGAMKGHNSNNAMYFSPDTLSKILDEIGDNLNVIIFHFQGEPLLNKQISQLIRMAKSYGIYTILSTNAQLLTSEMARQLINSGLDKIIVSIDGFTQETYQQYRIGGSLEKALAGLKFLRAAKETNRSDIEIELQCLRLKSNEGQWAWLKQNYKSLGADTLTLKTAQFNNFRHGNRLMPTESKYSRYRRGKNGIYERKKPYHNFCYRLWSGCVIDAEGNVLPCCFDKNHRYIFGNITKESFVDIWFGKEANDFRKQLLHERKKIKMCLNCTE
ncbi:MAG: radical SAM protein [Paludibacteraceae bacterium]|nr:radical SAM protein [Paludibacteraceae bacterium]